MPWFEKLGQRARELNREVAALLLAARHPRTPWYAKLLMLLIVAYAVSPIDLIPDFIPVLGYLDELILLPAALYLTLRLTPTTVLEDSRARAADWLAARKTRPVSYPAAFVVVLIWIVLAWLLLRLASPLLSSR